MGSVGSLPRQFPLFNFCLLVSSVSDFCPVTGGWGRWRGRRGNGGGYIYIIGSVVQSRCGEGGMLQTGNTGVCLQCLSPAGPAPAHSEHHSGSMLLHWELSEASPRLHAPPQSKPLRLGTQVALRGADSVGPAFCVLSRSE